jgi:hypothetical protein
VPLPPIATLPIGKTDITVVANEDGWHFHRWRTGGRPPADIEVEPKDRLRTFATPREAVDWFRGNYAWKVTA